jgi:hypothetical protein
MCAALIEVSECQVHVDRVSKPKLYKLLCVCVEATCSALAMKHVRRSEKCIFIIAGVIDWVQNLVSALCRQEMDLREAQRFCF